MAEGNTTSNLVSRLREIASATAKHGAYLGEPRAQQESQELSDAAAEIERLTAERDRFEELRDEWRSIAKRRIAEVNRLRPALERAGQRLTSLAKQARCRCQATSGYTHHCEACRALKHAEDIVVMLRGDVPAPSGATDETFDEQG